MSVRGWPWWCQLGPPNWEGGFQYNERAAHLGHTRAQFNLGYQYHTGKGVDQNLVAAEEWYEKAAQAGMGEACVNLAEMYRTGQMTGEREYITARTWLRRARDLGNDFQDEMLRELEKLGEDGKLPENATSMLDSEGKLAFPSAEADEGVEGESGSGSAGGVGVGGASAALAEPKR